MSNTRKLNWLWCNIDNPLSGFQNAFITSVYLIAFLLPFTGNPAKYIIVYKGQKLRIYFHAVESHLVEYHTWQKQQKSGLPH